VLVDSIVHVFGISGQPLSFGEFEVDESVDGTIYLIHRNVPLSQYREVISTSEIYTIMKQYPKVPRYDHPTVSAQFFETGTGWITEKVDGSNLRFALYEDRFAENNTWDDDAIDIDNNGHESDIHPQSGDIVFGTKTVLRGTTRTPIDDLDGNLRRAARALRTIDPDTIRELHDEWGQLVFFAENMILSTLDYDYGDDPPPPLLGFDAYAPSKDSRPPDERHPSDPYADSFEGFLPTAAIYGTETTPGVFEQIDIPTTTAYEREYPLSEFDASSYEIRNQSGRKI
jgi:hypothetical protein